MSRHSNIAQIKQRDLKIIVGVPSHQHWAADFGVSLAIMMAYSSQVKLRIDARTQHILLNNVNGSILPAMRQQIVDYALEQKATHLLFLDSDMVFPRDTLLRLLGWSQLVVAANCATKVIPSATTARVEPDKQPGGLPVLSLGKEGLEKVWRVGTGIMLLDMRAFQKLKRPFFTVNWDEKADSYTGEDWSLCQNFENVGIPIFIDHGLSSQIGHVGAFTYNHTCIVSKDEEERVRQALA
jgi:hypothetical protein